MFFFPPERTPFPLSLQDDVVSVTHLGLNKQLLSLSFLNFLNYRE